MTRYYSFLLLAVSLCCYTANADERLKLDKTTILGIGELPKVTFVVPWRDVPSDIPQWAPSPVARAPITPLDREVFHRHIEYLRQMNRHNADKNTK